MRRGLRFPGGKIGRRLFGQTLLLSLGLTLIFSLAQEWLVYRSRVDAIAATLGQIVRIQAKPLASALWQYDTTDLAVELEGMLNFPYLNYIAVTDDTGQVMAVGTRQEGEQVLERHADLVFERKGERKTIGSLYLQADTSKVLRAVAGELAYAFVSQAIVVALVALFLLALLQQSVIRHLSTAAAYVRQFRGAGGEGPLKLDKPVRHDELDTLADAFNVLRDNLRVAREQQRVLIEHAPDAVVVLDVDDGYRFVDANRNAQRLLGADLAEICRKGPLDFFVVPPGKAAELRAEVDRNAARVLAGETFVVERQLKAPGGGARLCEVRMVQLPTTGHRLVRASVVDITDRRNAENAVLAAEKQFRTMLETIRLAAFVLDTEGRITFINDHLLTLTGWRREEALGTSWFDELVCPAQRERARAVFSEAVRAERQAIHSEHVVCTRAGRERTIVFDSTLVCGGDGKVSGFASIGVDVTDHRSVEAQLRHAQKMEAIGHLAGGIAHDFNNLLTVTGGISSQILRRMPEGDPNRRNLAMILEASQRATQLTRSLLTFSRQLAMDQRDVDVNEVVGHVSKFLRRIIGEDVQLVIASKDHPLVVHADAGQLEQVLMNLATNARDAMPDGGTLTISLERVVLGPDSLETHGFGTPGPHVLITVSDTGHGMGAAVRQRVFEPFFTTKGVGKGTGLGLSIVFGIVEQHGGHISVESEEGRGTAFQIHLPLVARPAVAAAAAGEDERAAPGSGTVLVVEDDHAVRAFVEQVLTEHGYRVVSAGDGQEAVARHAEHAPDIGLVVMDLIMPRMNGTAAKALMRQRRPDTKVLFMSGYTADLLRDRTELDAGTDLVMKPIKPDDLLRRVREMMAPA